MAWYHRLRNVTRRARVARDIEREIAFHLAECVDELMANGMSAEAARREARRRFGNPTLQRERTYRQDVALWLESVLADLRYAGRALRRSPGFTAVAVLSLGLGIGANTAIFSLFNTLVLRRLPVDAPEELVTVTFGNADITRAYFTNPLWEELREQQDALSTPLAYTDRDFNLSTSGEVRTVPGYWVSGSFFKALGVRSVVGRTILPEDDYRGCPAVTAVSHGFWQREFGGDVGVVGRTLMLDGQPFEIVGVVDPSFTGVDVGMAVDVYTPICTEPIASPGSTMLDFRSAWFLRVMGRAAAGLTIEQVGQRLANQAPAIFGATVPQYWDAEGQQRYREYTLGVRAAAAGVSGVRAQYGDALVMLMGGAAVVLLIACANLANLMLARATNRRHEVSIRRAIGSGRGRLVRQLLTESLALAFLGAAVGLLFAHWASAFLVDLLSTDGDLWLDLRLDGRLLGFTIAITTATGVLFGLAPAWKATRVAPRSALHAGGRRSTGGQHRFAIGKALVVGQLGFSLALIAGAGLLIGTLTRLLSVDTGFDREGVLLATVNKRSAEFSVEASRTFDTQLLARVRALRGVISASASRITPISGSTWNENGFVDGLAAATGSERTVYMNATSEGYFGTLRTPLLAGRDFDARDVPGSVPVAVINSTMAQRFFGEPQPLGRRFGIGSGAAETRMYEVIGVVADTKYESIDEENLAIAYIALSQVETAWPRIRFQARTEGAPTALAPSITAAIAELHPALSVSYATLADDVAVSLSRPRVLAILAGFFGSVAMLLAMIGLYGTLSYLVTSRQTELGVRLALGAAPTGVLGLVLKEVAMLIVVGLGLGVVAALAGTRVLTTFLFGVTPTDPATLGVSAAALAVVAVAAGALPAWRAARLDPMVVLRQE